jgi:hypothetical protein
MNDASFNNHAVNGSSLPPLSATIPSHSQLASVPTGVKVLYYLHRPDHPSSLIGSGVISMDGLCPPFVPNKTPNLFGHHYGIEFFHDGHTYFRPISPFEFVSCHQLGAEITYKLSHPSNTFCLDAAVPGLTSARIFDDIHEHLDPCQYAVPAAFAQTFLNGAVKVRLPSHQDWVDAYASDPVMSTIIKFIQNPGLITNKSLEESKLNANYRSALRQSLMFIENGIFSYQETILGSESYTRLQLVPSQFRNIIFVAFHDNPIGAHLNPYRTFHCVRLQFYWPGMYAYITRMCRAWVCLRNPLISSTSIDTTAKCSQ